MVVMIVVFALIAGCNSSVPLSEDHPPIPRVQFPPQYPFELFKAGVTGYAVVEYVVDEDGNVSHAKVLRTNHPAFGEASLQAVYRGKFTPGIKKGRPASVRVAQEFTFDLGPESKPAAK